NWSAPSLVIVLAACLAASVPALTDPRRLLTSFYAVAALTGILLVLYGMLMRIGRNAAKLAGGLLGSSLALTLLVGTAWLIIAGYTFLPNLLKQHWAISG